MSDYPISDAVTPKQYAIVIADDAGVPRITIDYDGTVVLAEGLTPDAASLEFWEALRKTIREVGGGCPCGCG